MWATGVTALVVGCTQVGVYWVLVTTNAAADLPHGEVHHHPVLGAGVAAVGLRMFDSWLPMP